MDWFTRIKRWHEQGLWSDKMVQNAVKKSVITQEQAIAIISNDFAELVPEEYRPKAK